MCRVLLADLVEVAAEAVAGAVAEAATGAVAVMAVYFDHHGESFEVPLHPDPSPETRDNPTRVRLPEYYLVDCHSYVVEEGAAAAAAGPRVTAAWGPWQSSVWRDSQRMNLE